MSPASILLKEAYIISVNLAYSSVRLCFINPASTCTVLISNQHRAKHPVPKRLAPKCPRAQMAEPQGHVVPTYLSQDLTEQRGTRLLGTGRLGAGRFNRVLVEVG